MGFFDWLQKKSSAKCRDNLTRGIPMFVEVCQRISASLEHQLHPSDIDASEAKRLFEMLWLNLMNSLLPWQERSALFEPWLSNPQRFSPYTSLQLQILQGIPIVLEIQDRLKAAGFDPGRLDGISSPETHDALRAFQNAKGLRPTGEPDEGTLDALGVR